jgi:sulfate transport system substrate-binding protein
MRIPALIIGYCIAVPALAGLTMRFDAARVAPIQLLNVSFDPTRELWREINKDFTAEYEKTTGRRVAIRQSHGGSASQARAVMDGLPADVVTLALWTDTDRLRQTNLIDAGWDQQFPNHSVPYVSTIVFVVRKGNPKHIRDWRDLTRPDITVITPDPMTSGNGKLSFLAAWGAVKIRGGTDEEALEFVRDLYRRVPTSDTSSRGAVTTFYQNQVGDVQLTWENEAHLEVSESHGTLETVFPASGSIRAEPPVAVVTKNVEKRGTRLEAEAYLRYLFKPEGQEIIAKHYFRPVMPEVLEKHRDRFHDIPLFPITVVARNWEDAQHRFFSKTGVFQQIQAERNQRQ